MRSHVRGHSVWRDGDVYRYTDTGELAEGWGGEPRACPACGKLPEPCPVGCGYVRDIDNTAVWLHDPCLGHLPAVRSACCGHGVAAGYTTDAEGKVHPLVI